MNAQDDSYLEPIPLEPDHSTSEESDGKMEDLFKPLAAEKKSSSRSVHLQDTSGGTAMGQYVEAEFKRPLNTKGQNATRVRTFHAKLNDAAINYLSEQINEWIDSHEDVEVKFTNTTIGVVEGKRTEPHLIVNVWY